MSLRPAQLTIQGEDALRITWSDGQIRDYSFAALRAACPCATCREKRSAPPPSPLQLNVLSAAEAQPLKISGMTPVGNYAYSIDFSDGHDTGIFTLELLRQIGQEVGD